MKLAVKRVYEPAEAGDGRRLLVDRLWPRGLSKEKARVDAWLRDLAPSDALRRWFAHDPARWPEFKRRYFAELKERDAAAIVREAAGSGRATLVFSARDGRRNNAVALKEFLSR
ncbi:MAG TPA: DUF488 family protein [Opitutaceae bacterium]|nr:DUF488 family protein [Opitutaceae bacterium]